MPVLIAGFEPFGSYKINPAAIIAEEINGSVVMGENIIGKTVPVSYRWVKKNIPKMLIEHNPKIFIGLGLSRGRPCIVVERVAINIMDYDKPDMEGYKATDEPIFEDGPVAFFSTLPIKDIIQALRENKIPASISNSAGTFLCNTLMYTASYTTWKYRLKTLCGFIHLPFLPEQTLDGSQPSMSKELMLNAIRIAVEISLKHFSKL